LMELLWEQLQMQIFIYMQLMLICIT
jgi:hypothetical protein